VNAMNDCSAHIVAVLDENVCFLNVSLSHRSE
jgi:hypothetical protein